MSSNNLSQGEKDKEKFNKASTFRRVHLDNIMRENREHLNHEETRYRQRAVALYFIDKLALRPGYNKEGGEIAETVGCCSLRLEHIKLHKEDNGRNFFVEFDFLGKGGIPYQNKVPVEKRIYKKLQEFMENKAKEENLFDELNRYFLNRDLQGHTAKVFRTCHASITLQENLRQLNFARDTSIPSKVLAFKYAVCAAAVLLNHRRAVPDAFNRQMANLQNKIKAKMIILESTKDNLNKYPHRRNQKKKQKVEDMKKAVKMLEDQLAELEMKAKYKEDSKDINIATTIGYYLDPRIIVAWCKNSDVPVEKVYNRTQRDKFRWAIDMAEDLLNYNF